MPGRAAALVVVFVVVMAAAVSVVRTAVVSLMDGGKEDAAAVDSFRNPNFSLRFIWARSSINTLASCSAESHKCSSGSHEFSYCDPFH